MEGVGTTMHDFLVLLSQSRTHYDELHSSTRIKARLS